LRLRDGNRGTRTIALDYSHTVHSQSAADVAPPPPRQSLRAPPRPADNDRHGDWQCLQVFAHLSCICYYDLCDLVAAETVYVMYLSMVMKSLLEYLYCGDKLTTCML